MHHQFTITNHQFTIKSPSITPVIKPNQLLSIINQHDLHHQLRLAARPRGSSGPPGRAQLAGTQRLAVDAQLAAHLGRREALEAATHGWLSDGWRWLIDG